MTEVINKHNSRPQDYYLTRVTATVRQPTVSKQGSNLLLRLFLVLHYLSFW